MNNKQFPAHLTYGFANTIFGECCVAFSLKVVHLITYSGNREEGCKDMCNRYPKTSFTQDDVAAQNLIFDLFQSPESIEIKLHGSAFQMLVWNSLKLIPKNETRTYKDIATQIGKPTAIRAVGNAVGKNPVAYFIPCHRVVRTDGKLGGFRWGITLKKIMLRHENIKFSD